VARGPQRSADRLGRQLRLGTNPRGLSAIRSRLGPPNGSKIKITVARHPGNCPGKAPVRSNAALNPHVMSTTACAVADNGTWLAASRPARGTTGPRTANSGLTLRPAAKSSCFFPQQPARVCPFPGAPAVSAGQPPHRWAPPRVAARGRPIYSIWRRRQTRLNRGRSSACCWLGGSSRFLLANMRFGAGRSWPEGPPARHRRAIGRLVACPPRWTVERHQACSPQQTTKGETMISLFPPA